MKVETFHSYGAVLSRSCADESGDFPQLRSSSFKVTLMKVRLSTANGGFPQDLALVKVAKYQQLRGVFHGPLAEESGNHVRDIHV
jgi:hypothetical protein